MPAEAPEREGRTTAEVIRLIEPATDEHVGAQAGAAHSPELQSLAGRNGCHGIFRDAHAIHARVAVGAREADRRSSIEQQRRAESRHFEPRRSLGIPEESVAQSKRETVHRAGGRDADVPVSAPSRVILHCRRKTAAQHPHRARVVWHAGQRARRDVAGREHVAADNLTQPLEIGFDPTDACGVECVLQGRDGCRAVRTCDEELREQGVVVGAHLRAGGDPGLDAYVLGELRVSYGAAARPTLLAWIFRIEARLDRAAARGSNGIIHEGIVATGTPHHPFDEVDARHLFSDGMLDLQMRVDLEEEELLARRIQQELDRSRGAVRYSARQSYCAF